MVVTHTGSCHCGALEFDVRADVDALDDQQAPPPPNAAPPTHPRSPLCRNRPSHTNTQFDTPTPDAVAWDCDCSICSMKRNTHIIVPKEAFRLRRQAGGAPPPAEYRFGERVAVHQFCRTCGICAFYIPRSNPDGVAVTLWCVRPGTLRSVEIRRFGGTKWEEAYAATGIARETAAAGD